MLTFLLVWLAAYAIIVALVWIYTIGLGRAVTLASTPRAVVIVAVKGPDPEFDDFLRALAAQDYPAFRIIFAVESDDDPAVADIEAARGSLGDRVTLVVAGLGQDEGQKTTNLRAAVRRLLPEDEIIVLADANIRPSRDWLTRLIAPLVAGEGDIVSGFAWSVVENNKLAAFTVASMSAALMTVPRLPLFNSTWGGSTAMTRACCDALNLAETWRGSLSDDLHLTTLAQRASRSIVVPREMLQRAFVDTPSFAALMQESHRWLLLFLTYLPVTFVLALFGLTFMAAGWAVAIIGALAGSAVALQALVAALALMIFRTAGRAVIALRLWGRAGLYESRWFLILDPLVSPLASVLSAVCAWAAVFVRRTTWAGITYDIRGPQQVRVLSRVRRK